MCHVSLLSQSSKRVGEDGFVGLMVRQMMCLLEHALTLSSRAPAVCMSLDLLPSDKAAPRFNQLCSLCRTKCTADTHPSTVKTFRHGVINSFSFRVILLCLCGLWEHET